MSYVQALRAVLQRHLMLLVVPGFLLPITPFVWLGAPFFIVSVVFSSGAAPNWLEHITSYVAIASAISLYFLPFQLKIAQEMGGSTMKQLFHIQWRFVLASSLLLHLVILLSA